ncbi:sel1 repeat family protein [Treponema sp. OMZ 788]|uniref:sel1 repeat family protein n=1 Tax=Treponema sp. OMZ 788 TaxID=2563664 RepID=UPI0020A43F59|nr:sel1 repeat family protein [Treponema sp. OMZ 788]UTC65676.1 sel1 repeat family protein [Treponema sp. OMZ 788]
MKKIYFFFCLLNMCLLFSQNTDDVFRYLKEKLGNIDDDILRYLAEEVGNIDDDDIIYLEERERNSNCFVIKDNMELFEKEKLALQGDLRAVDALVDHYGYIQNINNELRISKLNYWLEILVENNTTPRGQYIYYTIKECYNLGNLKRGLFWLYMSAARGVELALSSVEYSRKKQIVFTMANNSDYPIEKLKEEQVFFYEDGALRGSGTAAYSLGKYYEGINKKNKASYWYRIGAQNGNNDCMLKYAKMLRNSESEFDKLRSSFWIKKAVNNGNTEAKKTTKRNRRK